MYTAIVTLRSHKEITIYAFQLGAIITKTLQCRDQYWIEKFIKFKVIINTMLDSNHLKLYTQTPNNR